MARDADPPVVAPRLLAEGDHEDVMAARSGAEPLVSAAFTSDGLMHGRLWNAATGTIACPPVPGHVDGAEGTFDVVPTANGDRPTFAVERTGAMSVIDARTGAPVSECETGRSLSHCVCLARLRHRTVVVSVRFDGAGDPPCRVWDADSGALLHEFTVWFPRYGAVPEPVLLAGPEIGHGAVLFTTQEERVDDDGWPPYAYDHAYLVRIDLATGDEPARLEGGPPVASHAATAGPVAVCRSPYRSPASGDLTAVRLPGGELLMTFGDASRAGADLVAVGTARGRDVVVGGAWHGETATVWDLMRPDPIALIDVPGLQGAAVALDGTVVLGTKNGLFAVDPDALPTG